VIASRAQTGERRPCSAHGRAADLQRWIGATFSEGAKPERRKAAQPGFRLRGFADYAAFSSRVFAFPSSSRRVS